MELAAVVSLIVLTQLHQCNGGSYADLLALFEDKFSNSSTYNRNVRPVINQDWKVIVYAKMTLLSIVELNDISQSFTFNGIFTAAWYDELLAWNPADYGGATIISPEVADVWKPRVVIMNTLNERDPFKDDFSSLSVRESGLVVWYPGALFTVSCSLHLSNFPFDTQYCPVVLNAMSHDGDQLEFISTSDELDLTFYAPNSEWDIIYTHAVAEYFRVNGEEAPYYIAFILGLKRRSSAFIYNILLPVLLLSCLNNLIFLIPAGSGEKISYGITVLLAQAVFMTILNTMLPTATLETPKVTVYVFCLLIIAAFTVVISIIVVYFHHKAEAEETAVQNEPRTVSGSTQDGPHHGIALYQPGKNFNHTPILSMDKAKIVPENPATSPWNGQSDSNGKVLPKIRDWKSVARWINGVSFFVTLTAWIVATVVFLVSATGSDAGQPPLNVIPSGNYTVNT